MKKLIVRVNKLGVVLCYFLLIVISSDALGQDQLISYKLEYPQNVILSDTFQVVAKLNIAVGYHIYAPGMEEGNGIISTQLLFENLPKGLNKVGLMKMNSVDGLPIIGRVTGDSIQLVQNFVYSGNNSDKSIILHGILIYQSCNEMICNPPIEKEFECLIRFQKSKRRKNKK